MMNLSIKYLLKVYYVLACVLNTYFEYRDELNTQFTMKDKNMYIENVIIEYRDRPEGSESKLNTFSDGFKVIGTIIRLLRTYRPMLFFGIIALILIALCVGFMIPVLIGYAQTGLVERFPTLIVCGFVTLTGIISLFSGWILETITAKNRQDFEMWLNNSAEEMQRKIKGKSYERKMDR